MRAWRRIGMVGLAALCAGGAQAGAFNDIPCHWAYQAIEKLSSVGVLDGYPGGYYRLNDPVTREEFGFILGRTVNWMPADVAHCGGTGLPDPDMVLRDRGLFEAVWGPRFRDVPPDHWAAAALRQVSSCRLDAGAISGTRARTEPISRGEAGVALARLLAVMTRQSPPDSPAPSREEALKVLADRGVFEGFPDGQYHLDRLMLRDEVPVLLCRLYDLVKKTLPPPPRASQR
ncbi:MAG: S-layer homology domain-containing protein [Armatimonadetes bacterium]|nr:S-layer homology domain-containing protein [Armatimonadota bacterium]